MSGEMTVAEAGKKGGQSTSDDKVKAARKNGTRPKAIHRLVKKESK